jgi:hypothetical protein
MQAWQEVERRLGVAGKLAACIGDFRDHIHPRRSGADISRLKILIIVDDYEDGVDANAPSADPVWEMALSLASDRFASMEHLGLRGRRWISVANQLGLQEPAQPAATVAQRLKTG